MGFSRQEYWSRWPCAPPQNLPNVGIEPACPSWRVNSLPLSHWVSQKKATVTYWGCRVDGLVCLTLAIPWTVAHQAPQSMGFPRQEYWGGVPFPSPAGVGCHSLLQGTFPTQGSNLHALHARWILYCWASGDSLKYFIRDWFHSESWNCVSFVYFLNHIPPYKSCK